MTASCLPLPELVFGGGIASTAVAHDASAILSMTVLAYVSSSVMVLASSERQTVVTRLLANGVAALELSVFFFGDRNRVLTK